MKFEEIYIDGFGIFHDYHLKNLSPSLTVLSGSNEAGKSTILAFIKRILFGFPDGRSKENLYPPLAGGNHGGRIVVFCSDNRRYIIERYSSKSNDVKVIMPDGSTGGAVEFSNILGHINKDIFENVYAFSLTELQDFETLNSEGIKERLYSAGKGIGAISLSEVLNVFEKEAGVLFKERGRNPEINVLLEKINEIDINLREMENDVQKFDELHQEQEDVIGKIRAVEKKQKQIKTDFEHTRNLISVCKEIEEINLKKSEIKVNKKLFDNSEKILELQENMGKYSSDVKNLKEQNVEFEKSRKDLQNLLLKISPAWNEESLSKFETKNDNVELKTVYERLKTKNIHQVPLWPFVSIGAIYLIVSVIKKNPAPGIIAFVLLLILSTICLYLRRNKLLAVSAKIKNCIEKQKSISKIQEQIKIIKQFLEEYENKFLSILKECNRKMESINIIEELKKIVKELDDAKENRGILVQLEKNKNKFSDFEQELKETNLETLQKKEVQLNGDLKEIEKNIFTLRENRGGIAKEIEQIEQREQGSSLRIGKTVKVQKLKEKSEEWSVLILARTIMRKAIEKYEQERQPEIIKKAGSFFSKMTLKRYLRILAPLDEAKIYVEDKNGMRKAFSELSRGTVEQLYLSLRFGFIQEFNERSESLPVIFDDILVNFDPERKKEACMAIRELVETNQVFYFTCHPETVGILSAGIPDLKKINLDI